MNTNNNLSTKQTNNNNTNPMNIEFLFNIKINIFHLNN